MQFSSHPDFSDVAELDALASTIRSAPRIVIAQAARMIYDSVEIASLGPYSTAHLQAMYRPHGPYSVADPHPPQDPGIINLQTGRFYRSWVQSIRVSAFSALVSTYNTAPYADALADGTDLAIARPLPQLAAEKVSATLEATLERRAAQILK